MDGPDIVYELGEDGRLHKTPVRPFVQMIRVPAVAVLPRNSWLKPALVGGPLGFALAVILPPYLLIPVLVGLAIGGLAFLRWTRDPIPAARQLRR